MRNEKWYGKEVRKLLDETLEYALEFCKDEGLPTPKGSVDIGLECAPESVATGVSQNFESSIVLNLDNLVHDYCRQTDNADMREKYIEKMKKGNYSKLESIAIEILEHWKELFEEGSTQDSISVSVSVFEVLSLCFEEKFEKKTGDKEFIYNSISYLFCEYLRDKAFRNLPSTVLEGKTAGSVVMSLNSFVKVHDRLPGPKSYEKVEDYYSGLLGLDVEEVAERFEESEDLETFLNKIRGAG